MRKDIESFLEELKNLSLKYEIVIGGCGCCGSPYLANIDGETEINGKQQDELTWEDGQYILKNVYETPVE